MFLGFEPSVGAVDRGVDVVARADHDVAQQGSRCKRIFDDQQRTFGRGLHVPDMARSVVLVRRVDDEFAIEHTHRVAGYEYAITGDARQLSQWFGQTANDHVGNTLELVDDEHGATLGVLDDQRRYLAIDAEGDLAVAAADKRKR